MQPRLVVQRGDARALRQSVVQAQQMIAAGATRIGASAGVQIVSGTAAKSSGGNSGKY